jgi:hypothetical protein
VTHVKLFSASRHHSKVQTTTDDTRDASRVASKGKPLNSFSFASLPIDCCVYRNSQRPACALLATPMNQPHTPQTQGPKESTELEPLDRHEPWADSGIQSNCKNVDRSPLVNPFEKGGDHPKTPDVTAKISGWSTGQPQFAFLRIVEKKEERKNYSQYIENLRFGGDRLTTPRCVVLPSSGFGWSPPSASGLPTPDHLSGVTQ